MNFLIVIFAISECLIQLSVCEKIAPSPLVTTVYGQVQGKWMTSRNGTQFAGFLGIPYAAPPTGILRFKPPTAPRKWEGVRDASVEGNVCIQRLRQGSEDCLFLNLFTHFATDVKSDKNLFPVMVYIHGGGFYGGSCSVNMYGPQYLMDRNIVLVTVQYRLGVFGFLSTEDNVIPGNMGLKDQVQALMWVQNNIALFGGDPSKVTIFGNSAGAASVHLHMLSSVSKDLFAKAISQSGTALSAFAMIGSGTSKNLTIALAKLLNCSLTTSTEDILQCLQNKKPGIIQNAYIQLQDANNGVRVLFRPVIEQPSEHAFLKINPLTAITDKPWLVGLNSNEGLFKVNMSSFNDTMYNIHTHFRQFVPAILFFEDTSTSPREIAELIYNFYFKKDSTVNEQIQSLEQLISDSWFVWPTVQAVGKHKGALHCYLFEHSGEHSFTEIFGAPKGFGVSHMDELHYLFTQEKIFPPKMNEEDTNMSNLLVDLWVTFAEKGNFTNHSISSNSLVERRQNIIWEPSINPSDPKFLIIGTNNLSMGKDVFIDRVNFWRHLQIRNKIEAD